MSATLPPARRRTSKRPAEPPRRVLVVDDSVIVRKTIGSLLENAGYDVEVCESGEQAFERCSTEIFDLVISDVTMGALSGVQLCRLLRSDPQTADIPVVLLTAADDPRSRFWGRNAGAHAYVPKEAMLASLLEEVKVILARSPKRDMPRLSRPVRARPPMERLSQVLDELLFQAVVANEARSLFHHAEDRLAFAKAVTALAAEVADYTYLVLRLDGPGEPSYTIHARGAWPQDPSATTYVSLGLEDGPEQRVQTIVEADAPRIPTPHLDGGEVALFAIEAGEETLGVIAAFGGKKRLSATDRITLQLLAREMGLVAKSVFLMEQTRLLARTDGLTGLHNRLHGSERLEIELEGAKRNAVPLTVAICDVDHFKLVNDQYGHNIGDVVLQQVSKVLHDAVRKVDLVCRWGGEEFLVILPHTSEAGGRIVAERLRSAIEQGAASDAGPKRVTISIGIATYAGESTTESFVERADQALYRAKKRGRNRVEIAANPNPTE